MKTNQAGESLRQEMLILGVLTAPFLLNDFANIYVRDYQLWLVIDYVFVKAFPLGSIYYLVRSQKLSYADLGVKTIRAGPLAAWTAVMTFLGIVVDQFGSRLLASILPDTRIGEIPSIANPVVNQTDLCLGLALVAVVEEVVFRGLYFTILGRHVADTGRVFAVSSLVFGLIHWSLGIGAIIHTAIVGAIFMVSVWKTGSVFPIIIAHFLVNYVSFSGLMVAWPFKS
jgi:membrane protease YdiL (CAAX protease family)